MKGKDLVLHLKWGLRGFVNYEGFQCLMDAVCASNKELQNRLLFLSCGAIKGISGLAIIMQTTVSHSVLSSVLVNIYVFISLFFIVCFSSQVNTCF